MLIIIISPTSTSSPLKTHGHAYLQTVECSVSVSSCCRRPDDHKRRRMLTQCVCHLNDLHEALAPLA